MREERIMVGVVIRSHSAGVVRVELSGYLGGLFGAYRSSVEQSGARVRKINGTWETTLPVLGAPRLLALLDRAGIHTEVESTIVAEINRAAQGARATIAEGDARLESADAALAPTGRALREYQREGVRWLCSRAAQGALLADDMGLGKTATVLIALPNSARVLVICPAVAKGVWRAEVAKWRSDLRVTILEGRGCLTRWPEAGEILVVNYDVLGEVPKAPCPEGVVVIADEAHALKNGKALRTSRFRAISDTARAIGGRTWLVTATPLTNRPQELWSVLRAAGLEKEAFGNWPRFVHLFDGVDGKWGGIEWGTRVDPSVPEMLRRVMLRRDKLDVAKELPGKSREVRMVSLDREGLRAVESEIKALLKEGSSIDDILEEIEKGDVEFTQLARLRAALAGAKLPSVIELVEQYEEAEEPLVVFSAHRVVIDALATRPGWGRISGDETAEQKTAAAEAFQRGELKGIAATIKAGGVAITLTRACNEVFVDHAWTPADNVQAEDRVFRIGQTRPVNIICLQANHPVDARVEDLLLRKTALYEQSIGAARLQSGEVKIEVLAADAVNIVAPKAEVPVAKPTKTYRRRLYWRDETTAEPDTGEAHAPSNAVEFWAARSLQTLSALDPDRAMEENGVGFNKADGGCGHALSGQLDFEGLTDRGWKAAVKLLAKYHRQVGKASKVTS